MTGYYERLRYIKETAFHHRRAVEIGSINADYMAGSRPY